MRLLLDTHVLLWWGAGSRQLQPDGRRAIERAERVYVSAVSGWEAAIKIDLGRLRLKDPFAALVRQSGFDELPVTLEHADRLIGLPAHHADPFDRMLVAQALAEGLVLVTHDRRLAPYQVQILWC